MRSIKSHKQIGPIWRGIYDQFHLVPTRGKVHEGDVWLENSVKKLKACLKKVEKKRTVPLISVNRDTLLPFLVAMLAGSQKKVVVLDFGGGIGLTYLSVIHAQAYSAQVAYHIIEVPKIYRAGKKLLDKYYNLKFHTASPKLDKIDILHIGSSLQYIKDWKGMLRKLTSYTPNYILLEDLYAGDIPTYATAQYYYGSLMPCWFFNIDEIIEQMKSLGFKLQFKSTFVAKIFGVEQESPQENFPNKYRLGHACNLLFVKSQ